MLKEKAVKKIIIKKDSGVKRKGRKKDNGKNLNINNDKDNDKDIYNNKDNLIDKSLNNDKDKLHNFTDNVLNNWINIAKLKEKILINRKKVGKINVLIKDARLKLDNCKKKKKKIIC